MIHSASNNKKFSFNNATIHEDADGKKRDTPYNQGDSYPDLLSSNSSQESQKPDIVCSSSSSSSSDNQYRTSEKTSKASTVSSFSSSDESVSEITHRQSHILNSRPRQQPLLSQNSGDNEVFEQTSKTDTQNHVRSEKGQRARSKFCSSGYGTGSGEKSASKTSAQLSEDFDNELPAVTSERHPEHLQDNVSNTVTIGSTLSSYKAENISNKVQQSNNIAMNSQIQSFDDFTKASNTSSDEISESPMKPESNQSYKLNPSSGVAFSKPIEFINQSDNIKSFSYAQILLESTDASAISPSRASLRTGSNQNNSSQSSSYFISPSNEAALPVASLPSSLFRSSGPGSQQLESQNIESLVFPSSPALAKKNQPSLTTLVSHSGSYGINLDLKENLERTARCEEIQCDDFNCSQIKKCINELKNCNSDASSLSDLQRDLLFQMVLHNEEPCSLPTCFTWCGTPAFDASSQEEKIDNMLKRVENFTDNQILCSTSPLKYMKCSPQISFSVMPKEKVDWQRLCMVENSSKVLLAIRINPNLSETCYWIIKKVTYNENEESLWEMCSKLRQMNCCHVVKLLWVAGFEDHLLICSEYEGYHSLHESLQANSSNGLDISLVHTIMLQLTEAAYHLHHQNIIYLNWTSANILRTHQTDQRLVVKLCNFTTSALVDKFDPGYLILALPTYLLPPELCMKDKVVPESDVWGLGCILYELLTGHPIWHAQRHLSSDDLIVKMKERFQHALPGDEENLINLDNMCPSLKSIFTSCWEVEPKQRKSVLEIQIMFVDSFVQSNQNLPRKHMELNHL